MFLPAVLEREKCLALAASFLHFLPACYPLNLFKKIRETKETFHAKMGKIKERNAMDLTEAEDIKKSWQEYIELYQEILMTQITTMV